MSSDKCFLINPTNGYWGLAKPGIGRDKLTAHLNSLKKPEKNYTGIQLIVLNTTHQCNLGCIYCSTQDIRSSQKMDFSISRKVVDEAIKLPIVPGIVFHGSEPLMNWDLIKTTLEYGSELKGNKPDFFLQSNLTLLDESKLELLVKYNVGISSSLDGRVGEHNLNRPYRDGQGTYSDVVSKIEKVIALQGGIHIVSVVTSNNVDYLPYIARDFEEKGITSMQFIPSVSCSPGKDYRPQKKNLIKSYLSLFEQTFDRIEKGEQKIRINNLDQYLSALFVNSGSDCCRACTSVNEHPLVAVDINGDISPCDFFFGDKQYVCGNILTNSFSSLVNNKRNFRMRSIDETSCKSCDWKNKCGGGCVADRVFSGGPPYYCEVHKAVFTFLSKNMSRLLDNGIASKILGVNNLRK